MSKRDLLRTLAFICVGMAFLIASGADVNLGSRSECVGIVSFPHWLDSECRVALVPRLMFIAIGLIPAIVLFYFANKERLIQAGGHVVKRPFFHDGGKPNPYACKGCGFRTDDAVAAGAHEGSSGRRRVGATPRAVRATGNSTGPPARTSHSWGRAQSTPVARTQNTYGFEPEGQTNKAIPMPASHTASATPAKGDAASANGDTAPMTTYKTCPDCAEDVRAAARKCRFCGYMFADSTTATT